MKKKNNVLKIESFNNAINGIIHSIKNEVHMKIHIFFAIIILILSLLIDISKYEIMLIIVMITLVIFSELINTSIEKIVDITSPKYSEIARIAKDVAAGAVLVNTMGAIGVGYLIFYDRLIFIYFNGDNFFKLVGRIGNVTLIILAIIILIVISLKAYFRTGTALEGGMPSGHAAIAFSIFTIIYFISKNPRINALVFIMALLVSQSRIKAKIHSFKEVLVGSIIGIVITFIILEILVYYGNLVLN